MTHKTPQDAILHACKLLGGQAALARAIPRKKPITPAFIHQMAKGIRPVPAGICLPIETLTNGQVRRQDLRPDDWSDYWPELKAA